MEFKIKISTAGGGKPFMKQLPSLIPVWENCKFFINEDIPECDLWVVYGGLEKTETVKVPEGGTVFITTEPSSVHKYDNNFLKQFSVVITCQENIKHPNKIYTQQALPWWVGYKMKSGEDEYYKTYDELKNSRTPSKDKLVSIIVSNKTFTEGHKKRYEFLEKLKKEFGNKIDIFGMGSTSIDDKWDAIAPYKYHIVLENSSTKDYFTEKLSDAFLGESYPIYYGCKNIYDYFSPDSLTIIDIEKPDEAIKTIESVMESDIYEKSIESIRNSKSLVLDKYQIFPVLCRYINEHASRKNKSMITIKPEPPNITSSIKKLIKIILKK